MITLDSISIFFTAIAIMVSVYLFTFNKDVLTISPAVLLISGIALTQILGKNEIEEDPELNTTEWQGIMKYISLGLLGIVIIGYLSDFVFAPTNVRMSMAKMSFWDVRLFGVLMAVAEEWFFRGFITNFFVNKMGMGIGIFVASLFFTMYHFAVYSTNINALLYVFGAGVILSYIVVRTGRLSPTIVIHVLNNVLVG